MFDQGICFRVCKFLLLSIFRVVFLDFQQFNSGLIKFFKIEKVHGLIPQVSLTQV